MNKLGIIAGIGNLPLEVATFCVENKIIPFVAIITNGVEKELLSHNHKIFKIGDVGGVLSYFEENNIKQLVICGKISRPNLFNIKVDKIGATLLSKLLKQKLFGDDDMLRTVAKFLEDRSYQVLSAQDFLPSPDSYLIKKLESTNLNLDYQYKQDIEIGVKLLKEIGKFNVGQAVIVQNGLILGIEGPEGTDQLILRCADLRQEQSGGVLIKMLKTTQDQRLDIPTIGIQTINHLVEKRYAGLAIQFPEVIVLDIKEVLAKSSENGLFISSI